MTSAQTQKCHDNDHNNLNKDKIISYESKEWGVNSPLQFFYYTHAKLISAHQENLKHPRAWY